MVRLWWEDLQPGLFVDLGTYAVTREEVIEFATKYDPQPFHIDDEAAAANPIFGRVSASGAHTFAMTSRVTFDGFARHGIVTMAGGGLEEMRFSKPVFPGDTLHVGLVIADVRPLATRADRGMVKLRVEVKNQDGEMVMSYTGTIFTLRRPVPSSPA